MGKAKKPVWIAPTTEYQDLHFPSAGLDRSAGFARQPNRPLGSSKQYRRTCYLGVNVRGYDPLTDRNRGGQRFGLDKFLQAQVAGEEWIIQDLAVAVGVGGVPVQTSPSGRVVSLVAVSEGRVFYVNAGDTVWTEGTNNTGEVPPLNFTGIMFSAPNQQKLWFVDGINAVVFTPSTGSVDKWTATAGTFPVDADNNFPRLVETWRGRTLLSGLIKDPQNIFMSRVDAPTDFDYSPVSPSALDAVALNLPNGLGLIGDPVTTMCPYNDDTLVVGCDNSIRIIRGDPLAAGQIDTVSQAIGMAWGRPWARDPNGNLYFFSNRCDVYVMQPGTQGAQPQRISQNINSLLQDIDTGANIIRLLWDDRRQSLHVFVTLLAEPADTTHFVWEQRSGAWWTDKFANNDHNPIAVCTFDGNLPNDRVSLIGSWDGYVRSLSVDATDDDGTRIDSEVIIGPIVSKDLSELTITDAIGTFGSNSEDVIYEVLLGSSPEEALNSEPVETGTWTANRNESVYLAWSAHAFFIRLKSLPKKPNQWAMESIRLSVRGRGRVRARQQ